MLLAVCANAASVIFKGIAWKGVVDALPTMRQRSRLRDLISPLFIGFMFNTILAARVGEVAKVLLARRKLAARDIRLQTTTLLGTVVAENLVSTITWVGLVDRHRALPAPALLRLDHRHRAGRRRA